MSTTNPGSPALGAVPASARPERASEPPTASPAGGGA